MNFAIVIIVAVVFMIIGFLLGNAFPLFARFINPETSNENQEDTSPSPDEELASYEGATPAEPESSIFEEMHTQDYALQLEMPPSTEATRIEMQGAKIQQPVSQPNMGEENAPEKDSPRSILPLEQLVERLPKLAAPPIGFEHFLQVYRDEKNRLILRTGDHLLQPGAELNEEERGKLSRLLLDLNEWVGIEAQIKAHEEAERLRQQELSPGATRDYTKGRMKVAATTDKSPSFVEMFVRGIQADANAPLPEGLVSIAEQIDFVLQEKLENTPYAKRGIRLKDAPGEGIRFVVGLQEYTDIGAIPDEDIRAIIQSAVKEWENRLDE